MNVEEKRIVGDDRNDQVAIVSIAVPAGGEVVIDRTWRFEGWELSRKPWPGGVKVKVEEPRRLVVSGDDDEGWSAR